MQALADVGCLTDQEYQILESGYRFLRKVEHRLQLLFDQQTHSLPSGEEELRKLALRTGYRDTELAASPTLSPAGPDPSGRPAGQTTALIRRHLEAEAASHAANALAEFLREYKTKTDLNRKILDHLLHQTFQGEDGRAEPESDLILVPSADPETLAAVLGRYHFRDVAGAYHNLMQLAQESVPWLSTRRCRHFLASIAPQLLRALAETPDPDLALVNLEKVTASLGAKAILWELFSFNQPSLKLYVDLCAWSPFLSEILINNPGMIDELLDSLVLNQPRTRDELQAELAELCRGAADPAPILHSFQDKELLRIGVRDILGKDTIQQTTAALSDLAETILVQIAVLQEPGLPRRFGVPYLAQGKRAGQASRYVILSLGKLGGRELSYHSDLDLILVYEGDGRTGPPPGASRFDRFELTDNFHYFTELTQRIIKATSLLGPWGRLYQVDMRLRPTGKSGSLVIPLTEFRRYYEEGGAQLWERQSLTRARLVHGDAEFGQEVMDTVAHAAYGLPWKPELADEIREMRERLQASRSERDLKRRTGGLMDIEFAVQLFQLKYGNELPALRTTNTWEALNALRDTGLLSATEHKVLWDSYDFLRRAESRLRIVHNRQLIELPSAAEDLEKLARRMGYEGDASARFLADLDQHAKQTRALFLQLLQREKMRPAVGAGNPMATSPPATA
jgi:glutamate-ammonia-ligase adenylyltransferase